MTSLWLDTCLPVPSPAELPTDRVVDTLVVGAGLTGLTTAVLLARAGQDVVVAEARHVGAVATGNTSPIMPSDPTASAEVSDLYGDYIEKIQYGQITDYKAAAEEFMEKANELLSAGK